MVRREVRPDRPAEIGSATRSTRDERRADVVFGGLTVVFVVVLACLVLEVWREGLDVPLVHGIETSYYETQYYLMLAKTVEDHGGYYENPTLGAPFGLKLYDYAVGTDRLHLDLIRVLGLFGDPATAVNLFYLLTFPLAAAAAYVVLRLLNVGRAPTAVSSILFAFAPYHFARGEEHLFLSGYYAVPLAAYLVLSTLAGAPLFRRRPGRSGAAAYLSARSLTSAALCVVVASTGIYYAVFTLILLAGTTLVALIGRVGRHAVATGAVCMALILGVFLIHLAPSIAYTFEHGRNPATGRPLADSELLALKFTDLVLPAADSRLSPLASLTAEYQRSTPIRSENHALGPVAAVGFLGLLAVSLLALSGRTRVGPPLVRHAATATVLAFLVGTVGGASVLFAQLITAQIRGWNRISIFLAFLGLLAVAVALDRLAVALGPKPLRRAAFAAGLAGVLAFGLFTQLPRVRGTPHQVADSYRQDRNFVRTIERRLPTGAAVFQLPYIAFPESARVVDLTEADLLRGYLHSRQLRWSFGAMKGRPEDWAKELVGMPIATVVDAAVAAGFDGLYIDRFGYADRAAGLEKAVGRLLGAPTLVSASGRQSFFDLRGRRRRLEAARDPDAIAAFRRAVLRPLRIELIGFTALQPAERASLAWANASNTELRIINPSNSPRRASFEAVVDRMGGLPADIAISSPGVAPIAYRTPKQLRYELTLPPGETIIRLSTAAPAVGGSSANEGHRHYFRLADARLTDAGFRGFL